MCTSLSPCRSRGLRVLLENSNYLMFSIYFINASKSEGKVISEIVTKQATLVGELQKADIVIAEVTSLPSKERNEILLALEKNIPVLALLQAGEEDTVTPMFTGISSENIYVEYYKNGNIEHIIKEFIEYIELCRNRKGKFIVIEGGDAAGKNTQAKLLVEYLNGRGIDTRYFDFPQYYSSFHGKTVAKFLRGEFGDIDEVSPYLASLAYALDRASVKHEMEQFLEKGGIIVANRYATSNMAFQGAKFLNEIEQEEYLEWIYQLEYKVHRIPKEDIVLYLQVPTHLAAQLAQKRGARPYLKGKKDIHEEDADHIQRVNTLYDKLAKRYKHWITIDSVKGETIDTIESIHKKIVSILKEKKIIINV